MRFKQLTLAVIIVTCLIIISFYSKAHQPIVQSLSRQPQKIEKVSLPGMPLVHNPANIYADANAGMFSNVVLNALPRVYVPNSNERTVSVIDPATYTVINKFVTGRNPQHIVPAYDLKTLYVLNDKSNSLTPIDPTTAKPGKSITVADPYNLYFTPDGKYAIVVSEAYKRLEFYDAQTMKLHDSMPVQCRGANHMDFTPDGLYAVVTCEFSGQLFKFDVAAHKIISYLPLSTPKMHSMPQDIRITPDGNVFLVADMMMGGLILVDPVSFRQIGFIPTGPGAHGIYPSRDGKYFYVSNRGCSSMRRCPRHGQGSVAVVDPATMKVIATWPIPGGGSPDMGNVSADGKELWLSGRYDSEVYVFDTATGKLTHRIPVGRGPHGLAVWPQPGRYSLGHTGNMR